jgi:SAM-dependent methyltransferase
MADLSELASGTFDLIFNPVSNAFAESLEPIWRECHRVLKPGGRLLCGFTNPAFYLFDHALLEETGEIVVINRLPYSDLESADHDALSEQLEAQMILEHSHSWETQIGGQCAAGPCHHRILRGRLGRGVDPAPGLDADVCGDPFGEVAGPEAGPLVSKNWPPFSAKRSKFTPMTNLPRICSLALFLASPLAAADWPHFLGPKYDLHSTETGLHLDFPESGPKKLWEVERGRGHAGPVVVGRQDRLHPPGRPKRADPLPRGGHGKRDLGAFLSGRGRSEFRRCRCAAVQPGRRCGNGFRLHPRQRR